jgi:hypothetical protein
MNQGLQYELDAVMPAATLTGLFVSLCTIQQPDGNYGPSGAPSGVFVDVAGLVNIPCIDAVPSTLRVQATEVKSLEDIMSKGLRHVLLNDYYPMLVEVLSVSEGQDVTAVGLGWRAVVDGTVYDLMGAEPDSQSQMVRLSLQLITT